MTIILAHSAMRHAHVEPRLQVFVSMVLYCCRWQHACWPTSVMAPLYAMVFATNGLNFALSTTFSG